MTGPGPDEDFPGPVPGPVLFARYAYPPNALGYCGPDDPAALLGLGAEGRALGDLAALVPRFEGAWPYLQLIAACNGIADPLDRRVVEAYWIGNGLLRRIPLSLLARSLQDRFARRAGSRCADLVVPAMSGVAQHSLHVLAVYPWLGMLRAGRQAAPLEVLDRCRIRWGRVESVDGDSVWVRERRLRFDGWRLGLGPPVLGEARRSVSGIGFVGDLDPGDVVALHWDWVCDRLSRGGLRWLQACTARNLAAVNSAPAPGPAAVVGA